MERARRRSWGGNLQERTPSLGLASRSIPALGKHQPAVLDTRGGDPRCQTPQPVVGASGGPTPGREGLQPLAPTFPVNGSLGVRKCELIYCFFTSWELGTVRPSLREVNYLAQGHTATRRQSQDVTPNPMACKCFAVQLGWVGGHVQCSVGPERKCWGQLWIGGRVVVRGTGEMGIHSVSHSSAPTVCRH